MVPGGRYLREREPAGGGGLFLDALQRVEPEEVVVVDDQPGGIGLQPIYLRVQGITLLSVHDLHGRLVAPEDWGAHLVRGEKT